MTLNEKQKEKLLRLLEKDVNTAKDKSDLIQKLFRHVKQFLNDE